MENLDINKDIFENEAVNVGIIDSACPKAVVGKGWLQVYKSSLSEKEQGKIESKKCEEKFKFGPSAVYTAQEKVKMPIQLGERKEHIEACVVDCDIPLLIANEDLERWEVVQHYKEKLLEIKATGEKIPLIKMDSGHYGLKLQKEESNEELRECFYNKKGEDVSETFKSIKKVHRSLGHKSKEKMLALYGSKGNLTSKVERLITKICVQCNICNKFRKTRSRPKVGLPKATDFNEVVSADLKNVSSLIEDPKDNRYVIYLVD